MDKKTLNYYMNLPYNIVIRQIHEDNQTYFYGKVLELDGCQSDGETFQDAYISVREAMESWLEIKLEYGDDIPEPVGEENYSGKFNLRLPKSLHRRLAVEAQQEGVSLNQYALFKLAK